MDLNPGARIEKNYWGNIINHTSNTLATTIENYLNYGLQDHYVTLLKSLTVGNQNYRKVGLTFLNEFVRERKETFSF